MTLHTIWDGLFNCVSINNSAWEIESSTSVVSVAAPIPVPHMQLENM